MFCLNGCNSQGRPVSPCHAYVGPRSWFANLGQHLGPLYGPLDRWEAGHTPCTANANKATQPSGEQPFTQTSNAKERPLFVAWQRPLLHTAENWGQGSAAVKPGSCRLRVSTVIALTRFAVGSALPKTQRWRPRGKILRPTIEICGVRLSLGHCHASGQGQLRGPRAASPGGDGAATNKLDEHLQIWRIKLPTNQRALISASEFRARAKECRRQARTARDMDAQHRMLRLAADYEYMARQNVYKPWRWLASRLSLRKP